MKMIEMKHPDAGKSIHVPDVSVESMKAKGYKTVKPANAGFLTSKKTEEVKNNGKS